MNRILLIILLFLVAIPSSAQFRSKRNASASEVIVPKVGELNYRNPAEYTIAGIEVTGFNPGRAGTIVTSKRAFRSVASWILRPSAHGARA